MVKLAECMKCHKKCIENKFDKEKTLCKNCEKENELKKQKIESYKCINCGKIHIKRKGLKCECGWEPKFIDDLPGKNLYVSSYNQQVAQCNICKHRPISIANCKKMKCKIAYIHDMTADNIKCCNSYMFYYIFMRNNEE